MDGRRVCALCIDTALGDGVQYLQEIVILTRGCGFVKKKKKSNSRIGYRVAAGVVDVFSAASAAIIVLLLMLGSLYSWLRQDLSVTFADLTDNITDAVIITDAAKK